MREGRRVARLSRKFASEQRGRSWFHFATTSGVFLTAFAAVWAEVPWVARLPAVVVIALIHVRLFILYHDYQHGAILRGSVFARVFFQLYGLLALSPPSVWKHTHEHHHRNNLRWFGLDSVGSYPVMTVEQYRTASRRVRFLYVLSRHPLTILFGYVTVFLYGFCIVPFLASPRRHLDAAVAVFAHVGLIVLFVSFRPDVAIFGLVLPWFAASACGSYLFYAQHNFPGVKLRPGERWDPVFAALHSSSYLRMHPILRWFTGNIGYHHVHHLNARIPFYRLPETMRSCEALQSPGTTSLKPADIVRCLRLKLWDPEKERFVGFAAARRPRTVAHSSSPG